MKKRMLAFLLCLCLCLCLFPAAAMASEEPMVSVAADEAEVPVVLDIPELALPEETPVEPEEEVPAEPKATASVDGESASYTISFGFNDPGGKALVSINGEPAITVIPDSSITIDGDDVITVTAHPEVSRAISTVKTMDGPSEVEYFPPWAVVTVSIPSAAASGTV